jgi:hypothetical protein
MQRWVAAAAVVLTATALPATTVSAQPSTGPLVTIMFGRAMWSQSETCRAVPGQPTVVEVAEHLRRRGVRATGVVVPARTSEHGVQCLNGNLYPSWDELATLRDSYGWNFVSNGLNRVDITALSPAQQRNESCGSLPPFEAHGHHRAWGMYGPGTNRVTPAISTNLISTCFAFTRYYSGTSINRSKAAAPPYYVLTDDTGGGDCAVGPCTGSSGIGKQYRTPAQIIPQFTAATSDEWVVFSTYKLVTGSKSTGNRRWDCTSPDPNKHWTNEIESYCLDDFLAVMDAIPEGSIVTDPADVAQRWNRVPPTATVRPIGPYQALPSPLHGFGEFYPLPSPTRIVDTRATADPLDAGERRRVQISGMAGVPADANMVTLNLTVTAPSSPGWLAVTPSGSPPSPVSNVNFGLHETTANLVTARVGGGGGIDVVMGTGSGHVLIDVVGWFGSDRTLAPGAKLTTQLPTRKLDTRSSGRVGPGDVVAVHVVPPGTGVTGVVMNLTGTAPTATTFVTAYPGDHPRPIASSLNLVAGQTKANLVMLRVPPSGVVNLYNSAGATHLIVDVLGTFRPAAAGDNSPSGRLLPLVSPVRLLDTRATGQPPAGPSDVRWDLSSLELPAPTPVDAVVMNLTATGASSTTFLTVHAAGTPVPVASNLNLAPGRAAANQTVGELSAANALQIFNESGEVDYIIDVTAVIMA